MNDPLHDALVEAINTSPDPDAKPLTPEQFGEIRKRLRAEVYVNDLKQETQERDS